MIIIPKKVANRIGRFRILYFSDLSIKGQRIKTVTATSCRAMPRNLLGMSLSIAYGARKYHSGRICSGVLKGSAGVAASGGRNRAGTKEMMENMIIK